MICDNLCIKDGKLYFAGADACALAGKYGTPLYVMDEDKIREKLGIYKKVLTSNFGPASVPLYASKACSFKRIYEIVAEEGVGIDVVSSGEIYTAKKAGFDLGKAYFHSNNKTDSDISFAMDCGVGFFVADNIEEVLAIEKEAGRRGRVQNILLRLTPGIDPHTYAAVATGKVDSKFGSAIETGQAEEITAETLKLEHVALCGYHCHLGSQVFAEDVFERAAVIMLEFSAFIKKKYGFEAAQLNLGGGYGVRYAEDDPHLDIGEKLQGVADVIMDCCARLGLSVPEVHVEPGRSIVADAGLTLYTVGTVKKIPGYKNYVSIDGGMADNPRYALYKAKYTCMLAGKADEPCDFKASVVGRCCESGDTIQEDVSLPSSVGRGDVLAVLTTGAYNYSMASNYNRLCRPPVVMLKDGKDYIAVRRETFEDLTACDI